MIGTLSRGGNQVYIPTVEARGSMTKCDCSERIGIKIYSWKQFEEFFKEQVNMDYLLKFL